MKHKQLIVPFQKYEPYRYKGLERTKRVRSAKIAKIKAALEISRRFGEEKTKRRSKIESAKDVVDILLP